MEGVGYILEGQTYFTLKPFDMMQDEGTPITLAIQAYLYNDQQNPHFFSQYDTNQNIHNIDLFCDANFLQLIFRATDESSFPISSDLPCIVGKTF